MMLLANYTDMISLLYYKNRLETNLAASIG